MVTTLLVDDYMCIYPVPFRRGEEKRSNYGLPQIVILIVGI